jgi:hypothetical protein
VAALSIALVPLTSQRKHTPEQAIRLSIGNCPTPDVRLENDV